MRSNESGWSIYELRDGVTGAVRYIGMTGAALEGRLRSHINTARTGKKLCHKDNWIRSQLLSGTKPTIHEIERGQGPSWAERERFWIADYKARGFDLTNSSLGGDSAPKGEFSPEHRAAMSKAKKGIKFTPEHCARISAGLKARRTGEILVYPPKEKIKKEKVCLVSKEEQNQLMATVPKRTMPESARLALIERNKVRVFSAETRLKMRMAKLGKKQTPEAIANAAAGWKRARAEREKFRP